MSNIAVNQQLDPNTNQLSKPNQPAPRAYHRRLWAILDGNNGRITGIYTTERYAKQAYRKLDYPMAYRIQTLLANQQFDEKG